jgi:hypothetical protein
MNYETYILEWFEKSYKVNGDGRDKEILKRIYLDGVKTGMAICTMEADKAIDRKKTEKTN